jgi:hypothetical protein
MIELDVVAYLNADAPLDLILGAIVTDTKIYPIQKPQSGAIPYIVYNIISEGTLDENVLEMTIAFECVDDSYDDLITMTNRMYELLDIQDNANNLITSTNYYIYWSKIVSGSETKDTEFNYFHKTLNVSFVYHRKVRW